MYTWVCVCVCWIVIERKRERTLSYSALLLWAEEEPCLKSTMVKEEGYKGDKHENQFSLNTLFCSQGA